MQGVSGCLRWILWVEAALGRGGYRLGAVVVGCGELRADLVSLGGAEAGVEGEGLVQVLAAWACLACGVAAVGEPSLPGVMPAQLEQDLRGQCQRAQGATPVTTAPAAVVTNAAAAVRSPIITACTSSGHWTVVEPIKRFSSTLSRFTGAHDRQPQATIAAHQEACGVSRHIFTRALLPGSRTTRRYVAQYTDTAVGAVRLGDRDK
jgi:hypothetical protein